MTDMNQLNLVDVFHTFQGEGMHAGRRALFIRMPFCNLKCSWCDTQFNTYNKWTDGELRDFALQETHRFAVITGGEPMMNKQTPRVIAMLKRMGYYIACESNGNYPIYDGIDYATVSPKREANYFIHPDAWDRVKEFKYVVDDGFDFSILKRHNVFDGKRYSLSPEFGNMEKSLERMFEFIKENPEWRISLQTHKMMGVP